MYQIRSQKLEVRLEQNEQSKLIEMKAKFYSLQSKNQYKSVSSVLSACPEVIGSATLSYQHLTKSKKTQTNFLKIV
jgi:hypothetical protein